jgi:hypothetical protein
LIGQATLKEWRRDRDSNPGYPFEYTRFPSVRLQPLGHLSVGRLVVEAPEARRFSIVTYSKVLLRAEGGALEKKCGEIRARWILNKSTRKVSPAEAGSGGPKQDAERGPEGPHYPSTPARPSRLEHSYPSRLPEHQTRPSRREQAARANAFSGFSSLCPKKYWRALRSPTFVSH